MSLLAETQIVELAALVLEIVPPGEVMMENFEEMLRGRIEAKTRAKYTAPFMGTCVMPTSDQLKLVDFDLPYMPSCVRYVGCKAIKYVGGLMTPCGGKVKNSDFCNTCSKKVEEKGEPEYGTLDDREEAHDNGEKYSAGGKTEITFGDYLVAKKKTREEAKKAIRDAGLSINIPEECFARSGGDKKRSGRPKKAAAAVSDNEDEEVEAPKPRVKRPPLTLEEKLEKVRQEEAERKRKAAEREVLKAQREAKKKIEDAEKEAKKKAKEDAKEAKKAKEQENSEKSEKKKAAAEKLKEQLRDLDGDDAGSLNGDEDTSSLNGDDAKEAEEKEVFVKKILKGVTLVFSEKTNKVYAEEDEEHETCIGLFKTEKNTVNFYTTKPARTIIEEQLEYEIEQYNEGHITETNGVFYSNFYINDTVHRFDHKTKKLSTKKGELVWILNDDGKLVKPPVEDDDE